MIEQSIIPLITFLVGLIAGHRFALIRDKRKEFNEACLPLYEKLYNGIHTHNPSAFPSYLQLDLFSSHVSLCKRYFYKQAILNLDNSLKADREAVKWNAEEAEHQIDKTYKSETFKAAEKILKYLKRK